MTSIALKDWLFPVKCCLCLSPVSGELALCDPCLDGLPPLLNPCLGCAEPLPVAHSVCGKCLSRKNTFDYTFSAYAYAHPVDWLVHQLKFHRKLCLAEVMAQLMANALTHRTTKLPEILIPVALDRWRLAVRGFNQSLEIAQSLSAKMGIPVNAQTHRRKRHTRPQSQLDARQRAHNLRDAFRKSSSCPAKHVAIIDDVMTTGSTAESLARLLRDSGTELIEVWTFARSV